MKLGIYIGSFNPVHKGHISFINYLINNNYLDKIEIIPTGNYWNKNSLIAIEKRIAMLKIYQSDKIIINDTLNDIPYTYLLLREFKKQYPSDQIYLIMGADNIIKFDLWKEYQEIINNYKIIILPRDGIDVYKYINKFENNNHFIIINDFKDYNISSSEIRELIHNKKYDELSNYLDNSVIDYIKEFNLYGIID